MDLNKFKSGTFWMAVTPTIIAILNHIFGWRIESQQVLDTGAVVITGAFALSRGIAKWTESSTAPSVHTREFWLTLATSLVVLGNQIFGSHVDPATITNFFGLLFAPVAYIASRGLANANTGAGTPTP